jgi:hypothetical protein
MTGLYTGKIAIGKLRTSVVAYFVLGTQRTKENGVSLLLKVLLKQIPFAGKIHNAHCVCNEIL